MVGEENRGLSVGRGGGMGVLNQRVEQRGLSQRELAVSCRKAASSSKSYGSLNSAECFTAMTEGGLKYG